MSVESETKVKMFKVVITSDFADLYNLSVLMIVFYYRYYV